jgi:predicted nucleotidyltransferase
VTGGPLAGTRPGRGTAVSMPVCFGIRPPWSHAARRLSRAWPALAQAFASFREVRTVAIIGSYATGTPTRSSDLDVLVLVGATEKARYQVFSICAEIGTRLDLEVNALIYSTREFSQRLRERDPQACHMARGALLLKGALPPGAPRRQLRRSPPTRQGVIPLGRAVSDRKIANLLETSDLLLKDSRYPELSDIGRISAVLEAVRNLVNAILEAEGYRLKGEDIDGVALERTYMALGTSPLTQFADAYRTHVRRDLWPITPEIRERILKDAGEFCESAKAWLLAQRPQVGSLQL